MSPIAATDPMADFVPDTPRSAALPSNAATARLVHSCSRVTTAITVPGLATAYALLCLESLLAEDTREALRQPPARRTPSKLMKSALLEL